MNNRPRVRLTLKEYALAGALGVALGVSGCASTAYAPDASPSVTAAESGEAAYIAAAEQRLDVALDRDDSFVSYPEMRTAALEVAAATCDLQSQGVTEAEMFDEIAKQSNDENVLAVLRYWITAATTYVC